MCDVCGRCEQGFWVVQKEKMIDQKRKKAIAWPREKRRKCVFLRVGVKSVDVKEDV